MDSQQRFRKLAQEFDHKLAKYREEMEARSQKMNQREFAIERICRDFAEALGWLCHMPIGHTIFNLEERPTGPHWIRVEEVDFSQRIRGEFPTIIMAKNGPQTIKTITIPFDEFTEEKFTQALENCFRILYKDNNA